MKVVVTGYKGNVGSRLLNLGLGFEPLECDVTQEAQVEKAIRLSKPDIIIHLAAKSSVDFCEKLENREVVEQTHLRGSANVFRQADRYGAKVVYVSSDHVFAGTGLGSYSEAAAHSPKNYYGLSKFAAEALSILYDNVKVVRTSTLFWKNRYMVSRVIAKINNSETVDLPVFLWRTFMHIDHFTNQLVEYVDMYDKMPKMLHLSGSKNTSMFTFISSYVHAIGYENANLTRRWSDSGLLDTAPRPHRAGLSTKLSESLGFTQYTYLEGISHDR